MTDRPRLPHARRTVHDPGRAQRDREQHERKRPAERGGEAGAALAAADARRAGTADQPALQHHAALEVLAREPGQPGAAAEALDERLRQPARLGRRERLVQSVARLGVRRHRANRARRETRQGDPKDLHLGLRTIQAVPAVTGRLRFPARLRGRPLWLMRGHARAARVLIAAAGGRFPLLSGMLLCLSPGLALTPLLPAAARRSWGATLAAAPALGFAASSVLLVTVASLGVTLSGAAIRLGSACCSAAGAGAAVGPRAAARSSAARTPRRAPG